MLYCITKQNKMVKINKKHLLQYYYIGWTLSEDEEPFPNFFEFHYEKIACLLGFNDFELQVVKSQEEIIEEVEKLIK